MAKYVVTQYELMQGDIERVLVWKKLFGSKADARNAIAKTADKVARAWREQYPRLADGEEGSPLGRTVRQGVMGFDYVGEMWNKQFTRDDDAVYFLISTMTEG